MNWIKGGCECGDSKTSELSNVLFFGVLVFGLTEHSSVKVREKKKRGVKKTTKGLVVESLLQKKKRRGRKRGRGKRPLYHHEANGREETPELGRSNPSLPSGGFPSIGQTLAESAGVARGAGLAGRGKCGLPADKMPSAARPMRKGTIVGGSVRTLSNKLGTLLAAGLLPCLVEK